jgi:nucleotide-binding universal stress UspA family protein
MSSVIASKKILVALDGSMIAENAAKIALQIAQANHLEILGLYIVNEPLIFDPYADHFKELGQDRESVSRAKLIDWYEDVGSEALDRLRELCTQEDILVETELLLGDVPDLILKNSGQVSYLALGRRGNSHMSSPDLLGDNFKHVAHHAKVPLIVGGDEGKQINRIFLFYDVMKISDQALNEAKRIQRTMQTDLVVGIQAQSQSEVNLEELRNRLTDQDFKIENIIVIVGKSIEEILTVLDRNKVDLLIMSRYQHTEPFSWLVGSPIDQLLRKTTLPVILA